MTHVHYPNNTNKRGLSLIETVIYVSILAILFVVVINTIAILSTSFGQSRIKRNVVTQGGSALERIVREVRLAHDIDVSGSTLGTHPGRLKLSTIVGPDDETGTTREFFLTDGTLMMQESISPAVPLTSGVDITNLVFYAISAATISKAVRIEMTVKDESGKLRSSQNFYDTTVLRRSY